MQLKAKTVPLLILAITAVPVSRAVLAAFRDPEGPNLVVVMGLAAVIYLLSVAFCFSNAIRTLTSLQRLIGALIVQVTVATGVYFVLR